MESKTKVTGVKDHILQGKQKYVNGLQFTKGVMESFMEIFTAPLRVLNEFKMLR